MFSSPRYLSSSPPPVQRSPDLPRSLSPAGSLFHGLTQQIQGLKDYQQHRFVDPRVLQTPVPTTPALAPAPAIGNEDTTMSEDSDLSDVPLPRVTRGQKRAILSAIDANQVNKALPAQRVIEKRPQKVVPIKRSSNSKSKAKSASIKRPSTKPIPANKTASLKIIMKRPIPIASLSSSPPYKTPPPTQKPQKPQQKAWQKPQPPPAKLPAGLIDDPELLQDDADEENTQQVRSTTMPPPPAPPPKACRALSRVPSQAPSAALPANTQYSEHRFMVCFRLMFGQNMVYERTGAHSYAKSQATYTSYEAIARDRLYNYLTNDPTRIHISLRPKDPTSIMATITARPVGQRVARDAGDVSKINLIEDSWESVLETIKYHIISKRTDIRVDVLMLYNQAEPRRSLVYTNVDLAGGDEIYESTELIEPPQQHATMTPVSSLPATLVSEAPPSAQPQATQQSTQRSQESIASTFNGTQTPQPAARRQPRASATTAQTASNTQQESVFRNICLRWVCNDARCPHRSKNGCIGCIPHPREPSKHFPLLSKDVSAWMACIEADPTASTSTENVPASIMVDLIIRDDTKAKKRSSSTSNHTASVEHPSPQKGLYQPPSHHHPTNVFHMMQQSPFPSYGHAGGPSPYHPFQQSAPPHYGQHYEGERRRTPPRSSPVDTPEARDQGQIEHYCVWLTSRHAKFAKEIEESMQILFEERFTLERMHASTHADLKEAGIRWMPVRQLLKKHINPYLKQL